MSKDSDGRFDIGVRNPNLRFDYNGMFAQIVFELRQIVQKNIPAVRIGVPPQPGTDLFAPAEVFDFANVVRGRQIDGQKLLAEKRSG